SIKDSYARKEIDECMYTIGRLVSSLGSTIELRKALASARPAGLNHGVSPSGSSSMGPTSTVPKDIEADVEAVLQLFERLENNIEELEASQSSPLNNGEDSTMVDVDETSFPMASTETDKNSPSGPLANAEAAVVKMGLQLKTLNERHAFRAAIQESLKRFQD
ncbi:hypothetical protein H4R33_003040, partial [Dimargaris cristalligena]